MLFACRSLQEGRRVKQAELPEYGIWNGMLNRCRNPNVKCFPLYGGRGIKVCEEWKKFENFYRDMGSRPSPKHSLDRIDGNGNYEPGNVRWATTIEQANNRRHTRFVIYRGKRMALNNAVRLAGSVIHYESAWIRITSGWSVEHAIETPRTKESNGSKERRQFKASERMAGRKTGHEARGMRLATRGNA